MGINIGTKNLLNIKYYSSSDNTFDPNLRERFLSALESFANEVFGDDIHVISLASFKLVCSCKPVALPGKEEDDKQPLLCFAITDKETDSKLVKKHLEEITIHFLNRFSFNAIFSKKQKHFQKFESRVNKMLGDLALKTEDRFRQLL